MNNSLTEGIDVASNTGIARLLRQSDSQVFSGWGGLPGINDEEVRGTRPFEKFLNVQCADLFLCE